MPHWVTPVQSHFLDYHLQYYTLAKSGSYTNSWLDTFYCLWFDIFPETAPKAKLYKRVSLHEFVAALTDHIHREPAHPRLV